MKKTLLIVIVLVVLFVGVVPVGAAPINKFLLLGGVDPVERIITLCWVDPIGDLYCPYHYKVAEDAKIIFKKNNDTDLEDLPLWHCVKYGMHDGVIISLRVLEGCSLY